MEAHNNKLSRKEQLLIYKEQKKTTRSSLGGTNALARPSRVEEKPKALAPSVAAPRKSLLSTSSTRLPLPATAKSNASSSRVSISKQSSRSLGAAPDRHVVDVTVVAEQHHVKSSPAQVSLKIELQQATNTSSERRGREYLGSPMAILGQGAVEDEKENSLNLGGGGVTTTTITIDVSATPLAPDLDPLPPQTLPSPDAPEAVALDSRTEQQSPVAGAVEVRAPARGYVRATQRVTRVKFTGACAEREQPRSSPSHASAGASKRKGTPANKAPPPGDDDDEDDMEGDRYGSYFESAVTGESCSNTPLRKSRRLSAAATLRFSDNTSP